MNPSLEESVAHMNEEQTSMSPDLDHLAFDAQDEDDIIEDAREADIENKNS